MAPRLPLRPACTLPLDIQASAINWCRRDTQAIQLVIVKNVYVEHSSYVQFHARTGMCVNNGFLGYKRNLVLLGCQ